ncbi:MAG: YdcF family protein [Pirellulales bacterium]|nr:YdcF family protein [Pirellulales bacterium]
MRFVAWGCRAVAAVSLLFFLSGLTLRFTPVGTRVAEYLMAATPLDQLPQADAIVVLGGDPLRSADALRIYRAGKAPMIILSGEAEEALSILDAGMVPRCVVRLDTAPRRTMDHPRTILSVGGIDHSSRLILVSSKLHQRRALAIFRQAGYNDVWMTSIETELHYARKKRQPNHIEVACVFYEVAARVKSWLVD